MISFLTIHSAIQQNKNATALKLAIITTKNTIFDSRSPPFDAVDTSLTGTICSDNDSVGISVASP